MQLGMSQDRLEQFDHYLQKCFMKTASLMAHSCQAVSVSYVVSLLVCKG